MANVLPLRQAHLSGRIWLAAVLIVLGSASGGCDRRGAGSATTIPREQFVAANVALRTGDTTRVARVEVLRKYKVTEDQLRAFVAAHAGDTLLAAVWEEIAKGVEAKQGTDADAEAADAPVQQPDPTPAAVRELPRVMQPRTRLPAPVEASDTAANPGTPAPDSALAP